MDYTNLISRNLPATVEMPPGQQEDTRFTFSVTYTDKDTMPVDGFVSALADIMPNEGVDLAKYPPPQGHPGLREYIAEALSANRGVEVPIDNIFLSAGAGGAVGTILDTLIDAGDTVFVRGVLLLRHAGYAAGQAPRTWFTSNRTRTGWTRTRWRRL